MLLKKIALMSALVVTTLPIIAYADLNVVNHTDSYGTASTSLISCSSQIGDKGIIQPHGTLTVSQSILDGFCNVFACEADLYASRDCSGKRIATVKITGKGIVSIKNYSTDIVVSGSGMNGSIDPGPGSWINWLKSLIS